MSRMRQVPVMDLAMREKAMSRALPAQTVRFAPPAPRPRAKKMPAAKLRLSDAPALLSSGCSSVREFCTNVQHITADLNQLVSSIENMLPLLTAYVSASQMRGIPLEFLPAADAEHTVTHHIEPGSYQAAETIPQPEPKQTVSAPTPEDIQQLLDNPLVKNLMNSFMQGNLK